MSSKQETPKPSTSSDAGSAASEELLAYQSIESALDAMDESQFIPINTDPGAAVARVLSTDAARRTLVDDLRKKAPTFDVALLDRARTVALGLVWADSYHAIAARGVEKLPVLDHEAETIESILRPSAEAASKRGLVDGSRLHELPTTFSYRNRISVVRALAALFQANWESVRGKVPFDEAFLDRCASITREMADLLAVRERTSPELTTAARRRQAAFTMLLRLWPEIQRAVTYVRGAHEDGEEFAPSLFVRSAPERKARHDDKSVAGNGSGGGSGSGNGSHDANAKGDATPTPKPVLIPGFDKDGKPVLLQPADVPAAPAGDASRDIPSHLPGGRPFLDS